MKRQHSISSRLAAWCFLCSCLPGIAHSQEVTWRNDYNRARQEAAEKGRPLLIDIGTENCYWCKQLDLRTFKDPGLAAYINDRMIPLRIDATRSPALAEALNIQSYPTLVFAGPDGRILGVQEGFVEALVLKEQAVRTVAMIVAPEWMVRDFQEGSKAVAAGEPARALPLLNNVIEDGKDRPIQSKARQLLQELERQAATRLVEAKANTDRAATTASLTQLTQMYPGTAAAREATQLLAMRSEIDEAGRVRRGRELLNQAREDYRLQLFACCLDRCEQLATKYADLPESAEAERMVDAIKANPEWMKLASDQFGDRLSVLYIGLAEHSLKRGQPQQAVYYLERVVQAFPNSRHAEVAQTRLAQIQGMPIKPVDLKK